MEKLVEKISKYHLINYFIPGAFAVYLSNQINAVNLLTDKVVFDFVVIYIIGLICSRIGSLVVEWGLKKIHFISFAPYKDFLQAEKNDSKLSDLNADNNMYRTFVGALLLVGLQKGFVFLESQCAFIKNNEALIIILSLLVLFLLAYRKQTNYIKSRVEKDIENC